MRSLFAYRYIPSALEVANEADIASDGISHGRFALLPHSFSHSTLPWQSELKFRYWHRLLF
jgi:hypothetical protein